jgi:hypothetical protein
LITFFLWISGSAVAFELMPKAIGQEYVPKEPWGLLALLGPVLLAIIIYKLGVRLLTPQGP